MQWEDQVPPPVLQVREVQGEMQAPRSPLSKSLPELRDPQPPLLSRPRPENSRKREAWGGLQSGHSDSHGNQMTRSTANGNTS